MKQLNLRLAMLAILMILAGCGAAGNASGDPSAAVEQYLNALVSGDADALGRVTCAAQEASVETLARTFATVSGVTLEGVACAFDELNSVVDCDGAIVATYGAQATEFPLGTYAVVQEAGSWKVCGEA